MANVQSFVIVILMLQLFVAASGDTILSREQLAPILAKEVVIPNAKPTPEATPWPEEFTIKFTTDNGAAPGVLIYDWGNKQQAIVHGQGASHCKARKGRGFCYILENPTGTFEIDPVAQECELTNPGIGTVPPTWVTRGVFVGVEDVNGVMCNRFDYPPSVHSWLESVEEGLPCAFLFPNQNLSYFFDAGSLKLGQPSLSTFRIPEYCNTALKADQ